jgi:hypothetical protein
LDLLAWFAVSGLEEFAHAYFSSHANRPQRIAQTSKSEITQRSKIISIVAGNYLIGSFSEGR